MNPEPTRLPTGPDHEFDLDRFVAAQADCYETALSEVSDGQKTTHWMWYIFPQLRGLGSSPTAQKYGITGEAEAQAYLMHPLLGPRLIEVYKAALTVQGRSAREIFGSPDDMKLQSSATLFARAANDGSVFQQVLNKFFDGQPDHRTVELLAEGQC